MTSFEEGAARIGDAADVDSERHVSRHRFVSCALAAIVAIALFVPLAFLVAHRTPPARADASSHVLVRFWVRPEPAESAVFQAALLWFPLFFLVWFGWKLDRRLDRWTSHGPRAWCWSLALLGGGVALWTHTGDPFPYWSLHALPAHPFFVVPACLAGLVSARWAGRVSPRLELLVAWAIVAAVCAPLIGVGVFSTSDPYVHTSDGHFESAFHSVLSSVRGHPPLLDSGAQYGLYGVLLAPLFKLIGLDVVRYSLTFTALTVVALVLLWIALRRATGELWFATLGWAAGVSFSFLASHAKGVALLGNRFLLDPYFQLLPIRVLFPASAIGLAAAMATRPRPARYRWIATAFLSVGVLWNLESGIVAFVAWLAFLAYRELARRPFQRSAIAAAAGRVGSGLLVLAAAVAAFSLAFRVGVGAFPDWAAHWSYQKTFYGSGFGMLPMSIRESWQLAAIVYVFGLAYSIRPLVRRDGAATERHALVLVLTVVGTGLFVYYQGRSHWRVFVGVSWPAIFLGTIFVRRFLATTRSRACASGVALVLLSWLATGLAAGYDLRFHLAERWRRLWADARGEGEADPDQAFLASLPARGRPLFLSLNASTLYLKTGTPPAFHPSLTEILTVHDRDRLVETVKKHASDRVLVLDSRMLQRSPELLHWRPFLHFAEANYFIESRSPTGRFWLLMPRDLAPPE